MPSETQPLAVRLLTLLASAFAIHCATPNLSGSDLPTSDDVPPARAERGQRGDEELAGDPNGESSLDAAPDGGLEGDAGDAGTCVNDEGCAAGSIGKSRCAPAGAAAVQKCTKEGSCHKWIAAKTCAASQKCESGSCVNACNTCTLYATRCVVGAARSRQICVVGSNGCTVWTAGQSCAPDETCVAGACN